MNHALNCVCEARTPLLPRHLAPGLAALGCGTCEGDLLDLADYRRWLERCPAEPVADAEAVAPVPAGEPVASTPVRRCPACGQMMERLLSGNSVDFRLDRCGRCQLLWMDAGEWAALEARDVTRRLLTLMSDGGQRALRDAAAHQRREAELRDRHGDAVVDELIRLRGWLAKRPDAEVLLTLIRNGW
jgi:Zn-finger nucleic acid-binding protein